MDVIANSMMTLDDLRERQKDIEHQWAELLRARKEYEIKMRSLEQREKQFDLKWDMLIRETQQLANDREDFQRKKDFYARVAKDEVRAEYSRKKEENNIVHGELFFSGVTTPSALKKRYKDLIKIYHPDSESGDNETVQEINREYSNLKEVLTVAK